MEGHFIGGDPSPKSKALQILKRRDLKAMLEAVLGTMRNGYESVLLSTAAKIRYDWFSNGKSQYC
jgi:hypothetical protein